MLPGTPRLILRPLIPGKDAAFILQLLNEPGWLQFIGDRGVLTLEQADQYMLDGPLRMIQTHGFGLYVIEHRDTANPLGLCGLLKRESLDDVDLGVALLSEFEGKGYAFESAHAVIEYASLKLQLQRLVANVNPDNDRSIRLLLRLGFTFARSFRKTDHSDLLSLYAMSL